MPGYGTSWDSWKESCKLTYHRPLASNLVYMPKGPLINESNLENTTVLIRLVGALKSEVVIAKYIKNTWKPRESFRLTRVGRQSFLLGFHGKEDFERLSKLKWDHFGFNVVIIRSWKKGHATTEDVLNTIPQLAVVHNIPRIMWGEEGVSRIASALGTPISAKALKQHHQNAPPPLELCFIISKDFA